MQVQAYHTLRNLPLSRLCDVPADDLAAYARTCSRRTRLYLLALVAMRG